MVTYSLQNTSTYVIALLDLCDKPTEEKKVPASIFLGQKGLEVKTLTQGHLDRKW